MKIKNILNNNDIIREKICKIFSLENDFIDTKHTPIEHISCSIHLN